MNLKIKFESDKIGNSIPAPFYASNGAAGMDLAACIDESITIPAGKHQIIPTGISIALPSNEYVALVYVRSSLGFKKGVTLSNSVGVIDSDYRGELRIVLHNHSDKEQSVDAGERIAQFVIVPYLPVNYVEADELDDTDRGQKGFGSTGKY